MSLTTDQLRNIQGDIWSKGFPKYYETYYLFSIVQATSFPECLKKLVAQKPPLISTLEMVRDDQNSIVNKKLVHEAAKKANTSLETSSPPKSTIVNALIAFTSKGLKAVSNPDHQHPPPSAKLY
jgi:hypothetical protein